MKYSTILGAFLLSLAACDTADTTTLREHLFDAVDGATLSLTEAIAAAEAHLPNGTVVEAELEFEHSRVVYEVELMVDGVKHEVRLDPDSGKIVRSRVEDEEADETKEDVALIERSVGWPKLIAAAEEEVGGIAYEGKTEGDDGIIEIEVLAADLVYEVDLSAEGDVLKVELEEEDEWEHEEKDENEEDEGDHDDDEDTDDNKNDGDDDPDDDVKDDKDDGDDKDDAGK